MKFLEKIFKKKKSKQKCWMIYCHKCNKELISSDSWVEDNDGIVKYKCVKCGNVSFWDFVHFPVPWLRTYGIVNIYIITLAVGQNSTYVTNVIQMLKSTMFEL